mgnify:CR=1 FL=1
MAEEQKHYIDCLTERLNAIDFDKRAMNLVLQDFLEQRKKDAERLSKLDEMLSSVESLKTSIQEETKKRKAAERKAADLEARLKRTEISDKVQYIGTCKSSYTKGCNLNRVLTSNMERQEYIDTITELKAMISSLKLTIDTLRQTISSQNTTIASLQESIESLQCAYDKAVKERDDLNNCMNRSN